jgi:hypothetical protein
MRKRSGFLPSHAGARPRPSTSEADTGAVEGRMTSGGRPLPRWPLRDERLVVLSVERASAPVLQWTRDLPVFEMPVD